MSSRNHLHSYTKPTFYDGPYSGLRGLIQLFRRPVEAMALDRGAAQEYLLINLVHQHREGLWECFRRSGSEPNPTEALELCADTLCCAALIHCGMVTAGESPANSANDIGVPMARGLLWFHYAVLDLDGLAALKTTRSALLALESQHSTQGRGGDMDFVSGLAIVFALRAAQSRMDDGSCQSLTQFMYRLLGLFTQLRSRPLDQEECRQMRQALQRMGRSPLGPPSCRF